MDLKISGSQPSSKGPPDWFTGSVRIDPLFQAKIAGADDFHISPFREAGVTYGTPTWIWSVAVEEALYVRAYNGQNFVGMTLHSGRKPGGSSPPA